MPAYWLARAKVNDPEQYKKYAEQVPGILAQYGGKVLARGGKYQVMEGPEYFTRFVVIEFPTFEDAVACFESDAYKSAAAHRRDTDVIPMPGEVQTVIVEALE